MKSYFFPLLLMVIGALVFSRVKHLLACLFCAALVIFRVSAEAEERKNFISWCQDVGILEVLPYHECDPLSRDQPDYLSCMIRLQVQNITSRYAVFVTGKLQTHCFCIQFFTLMLS